MSGALVGGIVALHLGKDILEVLDRWYARRDAAIVGIGIAAAVFVGDFGKLGGGVEIISATVRINKIDGLGKVELLEQMAAEAPYVVLLEEEAAGQLALEGSVEGVGVGRLEAVVDAPGNGEVAACLGRRREGIGDGGLGIGNWDIQRAAEPHAGRKSADCLERCRRRPGW